MCRPPNVTPDAERVRRKMRGGLLILAATLLVWVAVGVGVAKAAEPHGEPAPATITTISDETGQWLRDTLHADVVQRPVYVTTALGRTGGMQHLAEFWMTTGNVYVLPRLANALLRPRPSFPEANGWAGEILVHEWLHRAATGPCWRSPDGFEWEEGITQALTADVLPAWGKRFLGTPWVRPGRMYQREVSVVRAVSAKATGSTSWRTPAARAYRRALWAGSCEQRSALLALAA
jgi:hypothetical protein